MATRVAGSEDSSTNAALDAMKRFEGPANGIKLNPKDVKKTIKSSIKDTIPTFLKVDFDVQRMNTDFKCAYAATVDLFVADGVYCVEDNSSIS